MEFSELTKKKSVLAIAKYEVDKELVWVLSRDRWYLGEPKEGDICVSQGEFAFLEKAEVLGFQIKSRGSYLSDRESESAGREIYVDYERVKEPSEKFSRTVGYEIKYDDLHEKYFKLRRCLEGVDHNIFPGYWKTWLFNRDTGDLSEIPETSRNPFEIKRLEKVLEKIAFVNIEPRVLNPVMHGLEDTRNVLQDRGYRSPAIVMRMCECFADQFYYLPFSGELNPSSCMEPYFEPFGSLDIMEGCLTFAEETLDPVRRLMALDLVLYERSKDPEGVLFARTNLSERIADIHSNLLRYDGLTGGSENFEGVWTWRLKKALSEYYYIRLSVVEAPTYLRFENSWRIATEVFKILMEDVGFRDFEEESRTILGTVLEMKKLLVVPYFLDTGKAARLNSLLISSSLVALQSSGYAMKAMLKPSTILGQITADQMIQALAASLLVGTLQGESAEDSPRMSWFARPLTQSVPYFIREYYGTAIQYMQRDKSILLEFAEYSKTFNHLLFEPRFEEDLSLVELPSLIKGERTLAISILVSELFEYISATGEIPKSVEVFKDLGIIRYLKASERNLDLRAITVLKRIRDLVSNPNASEAFVKFYTTLKSQLPPKGFTASEFIE